MLDYVCIINFILLLLIIISLFERQDKNTHPFNKQDLTAKMTVCHLILTINKPLCSILR